MSESCSVRGCNEKAVVMLRGDGHYLCAKHKAQRDDLYDKWATQITHYRHRAECHLRDLIAKRDCELKKLWDGDDHE